MTAQRPKQTKCSLCEKKFVSKKALIDHIEKAHAASIPEGWSPARYENYLRTGKTAGRCVECKKPTSWNETTGKYNRMCGSEECKRKARERASKNYIGKHGKIYSINDPDQQVKMIYGRKNSGTYIFEDEDTGKKYTAMYDSSYGRDFLEMIDTFLFWSGADIIAPSPHVYYYEYEGQKHFYIPDVYISSLNLEVELKDGGDNPNNHPKIQAIDKVKEKAKDEVMDSLKDQVNYIKICNKDYTEFFALLSRLKEQDSCPLPKWEKKLESTMESMDNIDPESVYAQESTDGVIGKINGRINLVKRSKLANDPTIDYSTLLNYYRKKLFHTNLTDKEWMELHAELQNVQDILKQTINGNSENDERMKYEAKNALKDVTRFLAYMDDTAPRRFPDKQSFEKSPSRKFVAENFPTVINHDLLMETKEADYTYTTDAIQMLDIVMSLSDKEREYIGRSEPPYENFWKASVFYREVLVVDKTPVAFIEVYRNPRMADCAHIVIATRAGEEYRRKGYAMLLIKRFLKAKKPAWVKRVEYGFDKGNYKSEALGKSLGFRDPVVGKDGGTQMFLPATECEAVAESLVLNKKDIQSNFENWKPGVGTNILLVTGLSGSGKTTTGYELAYDYKAEVFQMDWIDHPQNMADSPETPNYGLWQDVKKKCDLKPNAYRLLNDETKWRKLVVDVFEEIVQFANKNPDKLFIVEGVQIPALLHDYPDIESFPIIIKGTSVATSVARRFKRDGLKNAFKTGDTNLLDYYRLQEKRVNWFRDQVTESSATEELKPKEWVDRGHRNLKTFRREYLTPEAVRKYKDQSPSLSNVKISETSGYIWTYHGEVVGFLNIDHKENGTSWIQAFEINPNYRGYGLSHQMLLVAVNEFDAKYVSVSRDDTVAQKVYSERGFKVYKETPSMIFMTLEDIPVEESTYIEATRDDGVYYPVFIFLSYTGTNMAKLIKAFTHDPYAHSSLSFDTNLENMVSFNKDGMVDEDIHSSVFKKNATHIRYSLYMYMATASEYDSMKAFVDDLLSRRTHLRYNVLGLTNFIFGRGSSREDKYFCSEFIASVISAGNDKLLDRQPYMISPYYFAKNKNFIFIKTGILKNYDPKVVDKLVAEKLEEGGFGNVVVK